MNLMVNINNPVLDKFWFGLHSETSFFLSGRVKIMVRLTAIEFLSYVRSKRCVQEKCEHRHLLDDDEMNKCGVRLPVICLDRCYAPYYDYVMKGEGK